MENEELIREDMEKTRESLTEKLETLEKKLVDSVQGATSAVKETMSTVKETMHDGVETAKKAVDIPAHVERQPWLMFGGSVLAGYLLGTLLESRKQPDALPPPQPHPLKSSHQHGHGNGHSKREKREATPAPQPKQESWFAMLEPEVNHLKGLALGVALGTVREMLTEQVPPHLAGELRGVIDAVTKKVGGEPLPAADFEFAKSKGSSPQEQTPGAFSPDQPRF
jgi:ElaB/YqjD/DUF883 family membrane-anchored ribosome-binding protein